MKRSLAILGSTGSIGTQALEVISEHADLFEVYALTANNQVDLLINQARKYMPEVVVIANEQKYPELKSQFGLVKIEMLSVYAFRDFAETLNTADEQEKLKAKQAEQQLRNEVSEFALKIASKVVRQQLSDDKAQARLVGDMLDSIEAEKK